MIFLSDIQGTIKAIVPEQIYQGSSNAKEIVLIAPFPKTSAVAVAITLPNGQLLVPRIADSTEQLDTDVFKDGYRLSLLPDFTIDGVQLINYSAWRMELNADITQYNGELSVQFLIATGNGVIETTSSENINIGKGTPYIMPNDLKGWDQVLKSIQQYYEDMKSLASVVYDLVIDDVKNLTESYIEEQSLNSGAKICVKVHFDYNSNIELNLPSNIALIDFGGCTYSGLKSISVNGSVRTFVDGQTGGYATEIINLFLPNEYDSAKIKISKMAGVSHCGFVVNKTMFFAPTLDIENCNNVRYCVATNITNCVNVDNCIFKTSAYGGNPTLSNCENISHISYTRKSVIYNNCTGVNGETCRGYYSAEDVGKVQVITANGTKETFDPSTKLDKVTTAGHYRRVYGVGENGQQELIEVDREDTAEESAIPVRNESNNIYLPNAPVEDTDSANKKYVDDSIANLVNSAPEALNTLGELAEALKEHEDSYDALLETVGNKASKDYVNDLLFPIRNDLSDALEIITVLDGDVIALHDDVSDLKSIVGYLEDTIGNIGTILTALHEGGIA